MKLITPTFKQTKDIPDQIISLGLISNEDIEKQRAFVRKTHNKDSSIQDHYEAKHNTLAYMNLWNLHLIECNSRGLDKFSNSNFVIWENNYQKEINSKIPDTKTFLFFY